MMIHIPEWFLWLLGVPLGLVVLLLAMFGALTFIAMMNWR